MSALFKNNATATLATGISSTATNIVLSSGLGALFPSPSSGTYFYGTLYDSSGNYEIVKCTARTTDSLTVVRGQEGTTALSFAIGDGFAQRLTAAGLSNFSQLDANNAFTGNNSFAGTSAFSGTTTVPTPTAGDSSNKAASTDFTNTAIAAAIAAIPPSTGRIIQSLTSIFGSYSVSSGGSWQATGHVINITPTSTSSKILVMVHGGNNWNHNRADLLNNQTRIYRNGSPTSAYTDQAVYIYGADMSRGGVVDWTNSMVLLDSPATTGVVNYQVYVAGEFDYAQAIMVVLEIL
jgi:hypothetical protein